MSNSIIVRSVAVFLWASGAGAALAPAAHAAASSVPSRVVQAVSAGDTVVLAGNTHPLARLEFDRGLLDPAQPLSHLSIVLRRSAEQERSLGAFNERQHDPDSLDYHHWLSADEFGLAYGPSDSDIAAITAWLKSHGLQIDRIGRGRLTIEFSGSVAQVQGAFQVQMHRYLANGALRVANDRDPRIPRALLPVVLGVTGLNDFPLNSPKRPGRYVKRDAQSGQFSPLEPASPAPVGRSGGIEPDYGFSNSGANFEYVTPYDFATIYNSLPLWNAATPIIGTGVTIAIVGDNDINLSDIATYRRVFGLPASVPTIIHPGADPKGSSDENTLDVEMAGAAAPGAKIVLVVSPNGATVGGILTAAQYIVDNEIAPIMSASYGECELLLGTSANAAFNALWQQGATQGISIFISSGDQGSAGCSARQPGVADKYGLQVNGMASSAYVTAVGGTDFAWNWVNNGQTTYWNPSNDAHGASAKGYVPEIPWNVNCANSLLQNHYFVNSSGTPLYASPEAVCNAVAGSNNYKGLVTIGAGSGGASHCTTSNGTSGSSCAGGYAKPAWQNGIGVPSDGKRDLPDVALFASYGWPDFPQGGPLTPLVFGSEILYCYSGGGTPCTYSSYADIVFQGNGGTSAASPYWAGIMALVVQKHAGAKQGLANQALYKLAAKETLSSCGSLTVTNGNSCVFYDVSVGSNAQVCVTGDPDCVTNVIGDPLGILSSFNATSGYDQATGLGSVNITNLVDKWSSVAPAAEVSVSPTTVLFATTKVGSTSATHLITVKNKSKLAVTLVSGGITLSGTNAGSFKQTATTCGASLIVGASCTVTIAFKPTATGILAAKLSIADSASGSPQIVGLRGTGK